MSKGSNARVHSVYLDELENAAVRKVAAASRLSPNAVIRAFVRRGLGLDALELNVPDDVADWAEAQQRASSAATKFA